MTFLKRFLIAAVLLGLFLVPAYYIYHSYDDILPEQGIASRRNEDARSAKRKNDKITRPGESPEATESVSDPDNESSGGPSLETTPSGGLEVSVNNPIKHLEPGFTSIEEGELDEAKKYFQEHLRLHPLDPEGHFGLGIVHRHEGEFEYSIDDFAQTLLLNPGHLAAMFQVAEMLTFEMQADYGLAEKFYQEILQEVPDDKASVNGLATVYLSTGRADNAIQLWETLRKEAPEETVVTKNLGEAYYSKANEALTAGNQEAARDLMQKAREMSPDNPVYERKWKEIGGSDF